MRYFAGQYTSTNQIGGQIGISVLVLATRETTIVPGIGKQMTTLSEDEKRRTNKCAEFINNLLK